MLSNSIRNRRDWESINESQIEDTINNDESMYTDDIYSKDARVTLYNQSRKFVG
jgi:hypothetical protein